MSILFVLLMFLLIISISYFRRAEPQPAAKPELVLAPQPPRMQRQYGLSIPEDYSFHPGHSWMSKESPENARIGIDSFASHLMGEPERVEVMGPNRWVRQGQKFMTVTAGGNSYDLLSPVEGVITAINDDVVHDPMLLTRDPYKNGWVAMIKAPDLAINQKNLVQGSMVAPWMQNNVTRLNAMLGQLSPALAQDGGLPVSGLLGRVTAEMREKLRKEFLLS